MKFDLRHLTREETREAVEKPALSLGVVWKAEAIDELFRLTHGYPFTIQRYARAAWQASEGQTIDASALRSVHSAVQRQLDTTLYYPCFGALSPREARFVKSLRDLGEGRHRLDDVARALGTESSAASVRLAVNFI